MNLYLVQHAESRSKEEDPDQSLTDKGLADIQKVAAYAAKQASIQPKTIVYSGKLRAQQTAEVLAEQFNPSTGAVVVKDLEPMADPALWAERLGLMTDDVMLVGHLPHLGKLAALLLAGAPEKPSVAFQNAGIVCLQKGDTGSWSLKWVISPDLVPDR